MNHVSTTCENTDLKEFGWEFQKSIKEKRFTIDELIAKLQDSLIDLALPTTIHRKKIYEWINGMRRPNLYELLAIIEVLGLNPITGQRWLELTGLDKQLIYIRSLVTRV